MYKAVFSLLLVAAIHCKKELDQSIIDSLFPPPPPDTTTPSPVRPSTIVPPINPNQDEFALENKPCTLPSGGEGECLRHYLCKNGTVNKYGENVIDIRAGTSDDEKAPCGTYMLVCCSLEDKRPPTDPVTPPPPPKREGCGWRNPNGAGMATTGETSGETKFGEFPWMVAVLDKDKKTSTSSGPKGLEEYIGGGSLIHPSAVLTVAHYVDTRNNLKIRAGEWDTQSTGERYPYQERDVASIVIHKDYIKSILFYDVALLFLSKPVELSPHIGVACLPPPREKARVGTKCFATGWGKDNFGKAGRYQVILKKLEVPVVDVNDCSDALRRTRLGRHFELHSSFMCAGGEKGKDTCKGDGGSPLSCPIEYEEDRYMQSGIVSWGIGCGEDGTPGVYVDVSVVRSWIDDKMAGKGYVPYPYQI